MFPPPKKNPVIFVFKHKQAVMKERNSQFPNSSFTNRLGMVSWGKKGVKGDLETK